MLWLPRCICLFFMVHLSAILGLGEHNISQSAEYKLRRALFNGYDRMVRPVLQPSDVINVTFLVEFTALSEVSNKDQVITTDTTVTQKWTNPFLQWNAADYDGIKQILVEPKEIWVPDIVLQNNADSLTIQAGYLEKFRSFVTVQNNGENTWFSPATFKSTCPLNVQKFPFDTQKCKMEFRSLTTDSSLMVIYTKKIESDEPSEELNLTTSNGYWSLRGIEIKSKDYFQGRKFSEVLVSFSIGRKPMFFLLFSFVPCMIIGLLILVSFFIPAESGERIGLCATILLAVSVYLLVVTEQLPEQSDTMPLIGIYFIVIMFEIGLALTATVLVLMAHHATSEPPSFLTCLIVLNGIACCRGRRTKGGKLSATSPVTNVTSNENSGMKAEEELDELESGDANQMTKRTSVAVGASSVKEDETNQETWKEIARALDRIFFWFFLALFVVSSIAIYGQAG